jgi:hypothetical protein
VVVVAESHSQVLHQDYQENRVGHQGLGSEAERGIGHQVEEVDSRIVDVAEGREAVEGRGTDSDSGVAVAVEVDSEELVEQTANVPLVSEPICVVDV